MPVSNALKKSQKNRSELYKFAKKHNLNVKWTSTTNVMEKAVNAFKQSKAKTIIKSIRTFKANKDNAALKAINTTSRKVEMQLNRFNRIRKDIVAPADKKLLIIFKDSNGDIVKSYHVQDRLININNLFINEENQYSSGADVDLEVLPTTSVEVEWLNNPKRSRSERKNFFRYLTKADYNLEAYQVYTQCSENNDDRETPCFLYALMQAGVDATIVKQISQSMFKSGATVDFIRKTANTFNLYISVKQYYPNKETGRADNNISLYGVKSSNVIKLGSVGEHLFAIKPTKITKAALDNPKLVEQHQRTDFIIKNGKASFNSKRIKLLDSYEVISYLYHNRDTHLETITQRNVPMLLNNKYQEVRELNDEDFGDKNFREIGRVEGEELNLGLAPFRTYIEHQRKFVEQTQYNIIYFDFETLVKDGKHIPYAVSYCIASVDTTINKFPIPTFSQTKNIYGFDCVVKFLDELPIHSCNLLWAP